MQELRMTSPIRIPWLLNVLMIAAQASIAPNAASAQAPPYTAVTTDSLRTLAENLKRDLQNGSIQTADLHAIELQLALNGGT